MQSFSADILEGSALVLSAAKVELWRSEPSWRGQFLFETTAKIVKGKRYAILHEGRAHEVCVQRIVSTGGVSSALFEE